VPPLLDDDPMCAFPETLSPSLKFAIDQNVSHSLKQMAPIQNPKMSEQLKMVHFYARHFRSGVPHKNDVYIPVLLKCTFKNS
jgi:hypothetical protein